MSVKNCGCCHHCFSTAINVTTPSQAKTNNQVEQDDYTRTGAYHNLNALGRGYLKVHPTLTFATFLGRENLQLHSTPTYAEFL